MKNLLRRTVLKRCGLCAMGTILNDYLVSTVSGQGIENRKKLRAILSKEFRFSILTAISSDGRRLALLATGPNATLPSSKKGWMGTDRIDPGNDRIQIVDSQTWARLGESPTGGASTTIASFFTDSLFLFSEHLVVKGGQAVRKILSFDMKVILEDKRPYSDAMGSHTSLDALADNLLLGLEYSDGFGAEAITLVTTDGWATVKRVPLFPKADPANRLIWQTGPYLSLDRRFFAQSIGLDVSFRKSATLELVWRRKVEPGWSPMRLGVSLHGDYVAMGLGQSPYRSDVRPAAVTVVAGSDGSVISHFRVEGIGGVAISPDGKMVAVGEEVQLDENLEDTQMNVNIYDVPTGQLLLKLEHDRRRVTRGSWADFGLSYANGLHFTPDGSQLISSGTHTKVWKLSWE